MADIEEARIEDFQPDPLNPNEGTEYGNSLLEKSISNFGAGRSIVVDKNGIVLAGNKAQQAALDMGLEKALVVETDGTELVVVRRTDLDLKNDPVRARGYTIADNRASEVNLSWDANNIIEGAEAAGIDLNDWFPSKEVDAFLKEVAKETHQAIYDPIRDLDKEALEKHAGDLKETYIVYVATSSRENFIEMVKLLSMGTRSVSDFMKYVSMDGDALLAFWREYLETR